VKKMEVKQMEPKAARMCLDGWSGRSSVSIEVTGEAGKRYRVRFLEATRLPHDSAVEIGDVRLVPKYSVVFRGQA